MRRCTLLLMLVLAQAGLAQSEARSRLKPKADTATQNKARGLEALKEVQRLQKAASCQGDSTTVGMENCLGRLNDQAGRAYHNYVLALGALIRGEFSDPEFSPKPLAPGARLPFDEGETAWLRYRDQTCREQFALAQGGTLGPVSEAGCRLTATLNHVLELHAIYSELWN